MAAETQDVSCMTAQAHSIHRTEAVAGDIVEFPDPCLRSTGYGLLFFRRRRIKKESELCSLTVPCNLYPITCNL
jgi:hypothetical protein